MLYMGLFEMGIPPGFLVKDEIPKNQSRKGSYQFQPCFLLLVPSFALILDCYEEMGYIQENNKWDTPMPQHTPKISETTVELGSNTPDKKSMIASFYWMVALVVKLHIVAEAM